MAKINLDDVTSGYDASTKINSNNDKLENAIENQLSRDGTAPNYMSANIDMNEKRVRNAADGVNNQDYVTLAQLFGSSSIDYSDVALTKQNISDRIWENTPIEDYLEGQYAVELIADANRYFLPGNPMRYGADPSRTNDSSFAVQVAVNVQSWTADGEGGGWIDVPRGAYKMDDNVYCYYDAVDNPYYNPTATFARTSIICNGGGSGIYYDNLPNGGVYFIFAEDKTFVGSAYGKNVSNLTLKGFTLWGTPTTLPLLSLDGCDTCDIDLHVSMLGDGEAVSLVNPDGDTKIKLLITGDSSKLAGSREGLGFRFDNLRTDPGTATGSMDIDLTTRYLRQPFEFGEVQLGHAGDVYDSLTLRFDMEYFDDPGRLRWGIANYTIEKLRTDNTYEGSVWFSDSTGIYDGDTESVITVNNTNVSTGTQSSGTAGIILGQLTGNDGNDSYSTIVFNGLGSKYVADRTVLVNKIKNNEFAGDIIFNNPSPEGLRPGDGGGAFLAVPDAEQLNPVTIRGFSGLAQGLSSEELVCIDNATIGSISPTSVAHHLNLPDGELLGTWENATNIDFTGACALPSTMRLEPTTGGPAIFQTINLPSSVALRPFKTRVYLANTAGGLLTNINLYPGASGTINGGSAGGYYTTYGNNFWLTIEQTKSSTTSPEYIISREDMYSRLYRGYLHTTYDDSDLSGPTLSALSGPKTYHNTVFTTANTCALAFANGSFLGQELVIRHAASDVAGITEATFGSNKVRFDNVLSTTITWTGPSETGTVSMVWDQEDQVWEVTNETGTGATFA